MVKYTNEELLEILPPSLRESKELTTKQKVVLGQLVIYNGLEIVKKDGYFYRSNKDLCNDCEIQEKTLIAAVRKLESLGFIERKKGARHSVASEYRVNEKLIGDYCKKEIDNYSNDYSKLITAMHVRITELEITLKRLVERITVIEGRNYSTDKDIDKELDIEKEINNNILNNNSLYNNIEETFNSKELETEESEENLTDFQVAISETPSEAETNNDEQTATPTTKDKQILRQCYEIINPFLLQFQSAASIIELNTIKAKLVQTVNDYINSIGVVSDWVIDNINGRITDDMVARSVEIKEMHNEQITKQLKQSDQYASYYC